MNILFLGKFYPQTLITTLATDSKGKAGMSNHNFEMSLINGLCQQKDITLKCMTVPSAYSFPYNNKRFFTRGESYQYKNTQIHSVGFCNLPVIKEIWSTIASIFTLIKVFSKFEGDKVDVIINTPNNGLLNAVRFAKIFTRKKITQTVIIPDIPSMVTSMDKQHKLKGLVLNHRNKRSMKMTSESDGLVLLTEAMMDFVDKIVPYIIMEGIVDVESMDGVSEPQTKEVILYTGTLRKIFGVMNLVQAFENVKGNNIELWICGSGDSEAAIREAASRDSRIKFFGLVDSQTALKMQRQATILVNPRTSEGEYTKYSFPSKTMEYLLSGKSVIINRLPGIPEEYYQYVYTPKDESIPAMTECITNVLADEIDLRNAKAQSGRNFIISQKNSKIQTKRILEMIAKYKQ